jgi:hypothetical protein
MRLCVARSISFFHKPVVKQSRNLFVTLSANWSRSDVKLWVWTSSEPLFLSGLIYTIITCASYFKLYARIKIKYCSSARVVLDENWLKTTENFWSFVSNIAAQRGPFYSVWFYSRNLMDTKFNSYCRRRLEMLKNSHSKNWNGASHLGDLFVYRRIILKINWLDRIL